jgi:amino acid transporter
MVGAALGALVSIYTALHYTILLGAQIPMVAARDGLFPRAFQRLTNRGTPGVALLATGLLITGLIVMNASKGLVRAYTFINLMATLATVIPYAFCAMAALVVPSERIANARRSHSYQQHRNHCIRRPLFSDRGRRLGRRLLVHVAAACWHARLCMGKTFRFAAFKAMIGADIRVVLG